MSAPRVKTAEKNNPQYSSLAAVPRPNAKNKGTAGAPWPNNKNTGMASVAFGLFMQSRHGYIGPIGDDFPSLIPLIFGLLMFFTAFTINFDSFDNANTRFNADVTLLRISRTLQSNSYIYSYTNFNELCSQIGVVNLKFAAALTEAWVNPSNATRGASGKGAFGILDVPVFRSGNNAFYCSNQEPLSPLNNNPRVSNFVTAESSADRLLVSRVFPIVVEDDKVVKPMHLVVVAWK